MKTDRFFLAEWYRSKRGTAARSHASKVEQALQSWPGEASPFQCGSRVTSRNLAARPTRSHAMHISRSFPLSWFGTPDGTRQFSSTRPRFSFILAAIAMQSRQMDENKNTFRAFHMFVHAGRRSSSV